MLSTFLADLRLYRYLVSMQIKAQFQYKVNLLLDIGSYLAVTGLEFFALLLFFFAFPDMLGWKVGEVAFLSSVINLSFGVAELVGAGIDNFPETIRKGEFDRVLLRPTGVFLQIVGSDFRLRRLGRISLGVLSMGYSLALLPQLHWTWIKMLLLPVGIVSTALIFVAILLLGATICFWTIEAVEITNVLSYGGREMLSYPLTAYNALMQRFFLFIVPLAFGSYIPVCYILERPLPFGLPLWLAFCAPVLALAFAVVCVLAWRFGVRQYQSTGN
ncbi:ABC transporter permease [Ktedonobacter sp. SOSP1-52]|uniref:ABC transporter permease n=1 Tax=Ktedonobacter sp. SOSP1-52 TaxID=2778366 RepID=UPI001915A1DA|nr:ABC-2 family transporter protein [Ktedonobacter sp. SOSP1-52]GHO64736.1 ABC transporter permease [Ktedonobacter sp. SOSP1-52]